MAAKLTIDAIVTATAALSNAIVITGDVHDFARLSAHFPGVVAIGVASGRKGRISP